jgi:hypothetical protein
MAGKSVRSDPVSYVFSHRDALSILRVLRDGRPHPPEEVRRTLELHPEAFRRARLSLAGHGLIVVHAVKGARWQETPDGHLSLRVEMELGPRAKGLLPLLDGFGKLARTHRDRVSSALIEEAGAWG